MMSGARLMRPFRCFAPESGRINPGGVQRMSGYYVSGVRCQVSGVR